MGGFVDEPALLHRAGLARQRRRAPPPAAAHPRGGGRVPTSPTPPARRGRRRLRRWCWMRRRRRLRGADKWVNYGKGWRLRWFVLEGGCCPTTSSGLEGRGFGGVAGGGGEGDRGGWRAAAGAGGGRGGGEAVEAVRGDTPQGMVQLGFPLDWVCS